MANILSHPSLQTLPDWVKTLRPQQVEAIERILAAYQSNIPVVVLDAPCGSGKTLIAECVRRLLGASALYVCNNKALQNQFAGDFPYAKVLMGRNNYTPTLSINSGLTCEDCLKNSNKAKWCPMCPSVKECPYEQAKVAALSSTLAVLNTSYLLTEANNIGRFSNRPLIVADEADTLESQLMGYISVGISEWRMRKYRWQPPAKVTVKASWEEWLIDAVSKLEIKVSRFGEMGKFSKDNLTTDQAKELRYLSNLKDRLGLVLKTIDQDWVYDGRKGEGAVRFKPARVDYFGNDMLWKHSPRWLLMSATVISPKEMLDSLGYSGDYQTVSVGSTFPPENRPVKVVPCGIVTHKTKEITWPRLADKVQEIVAAHNHKILVHTVSYDLARYITGRLDNTCRDVITYTESSARAKAEASFRETTNGVLVAPSMDRGVDLPNDSCRVQVITKIPYPNLGDKQVSARLYSPGGQMWYTVQTIRTLVQMSGRAVRNEEDWCVTYILDGAMEKLWNTYRSLFPSWFKAAVIWEK